jgi:hypothetical protein
MAVRLLLPGDDEGRFKHRGPLPPVAEDSLLAAIQADLAAFSFRSEGLAVSTPAASGQRPRRDHPDHSTRPALGH